MTLTTALICLVALVKPLVSTRMNVGDVNDITARYFPFSDPSRCRQSQFCGVSMEWDLKFGRLIEAVIYFPGNSTSQLSDNPGYPMNTIIIGMPESRDSYDQICRDLASAGNVVILTQLHNEYESLDLICDILRIAFDMYYENFQFASKFYQLLSNQTYIITFNKISEQIFYINSRQNKCFVHSSIKAIIVVSPSLQRNPTLATATNQAQGIKTLNIPILFVSATNDAHHPIFHSKYLYNQLTTGNELKKHNKNGVCKWYIELQGGNHCYFADYNITRESECLRKEYESRNFKGIKMNHQFQLSTYGAPLFLKYINFIYNRVNDPTNETNAEMWLDYLNYHRNNRSNIEYLGSCFVNNRLFVHSQYFSPNENLELYRTFSWN